MLYSFVTNRAGKDAKELTYGELVDKVRNGDVAELTIKQAEVVSVNKNKTQFKTPSEGEKIKGALAALANGKGPEGQPHVPSKKVNIEPATSGAFWSILMWWGPVLLLVGFWIFMLRQMQSGGNK